VPVDLDVDPRLADEVGRIRLVRLGERQELADGVAAYPELRMYDEVDREALPVELRRHGVDEERHVVGHNLDDAVRAGPAALFLLRADHADERGARRAAPRELEL
jgi:hypothetical protein